MATDIVNLQCGVSLPSMSINVEANHCVILAHGLGATDPKRKDYTDKWIQMALRQLQSNRDVGIVAYTARGHGQSHGWETTAESDIQQFTWRNLATDMMGVADHYAKDTFIACGNSMGAASALYAALYYPNRVDAVIMIRPPTAWETRRARKGCLQGSADNLLSRYPGGVYHFVLMGAAESDLPPIDCDIYGEISCPVLILAHEQDPAHPTSVAMALSRAIANAEIHIAESVGEAHATWGGIIGGFVERVSMGRRTGRADCQG